MLQECNRKRCCEEPLILWETTDLNPTSQKDVIKDTPWRHWSVRALVMLQYGKYSIFGTIHATIYSANEATPPSNRSYFVKRHLGVTISKECDSINEAGYLHATHPTWIRQRFSAYTPAKLDDYESGSVVYRPSLTTSPLWVEYWTGADRWWLAMPYPPNSFTMRVMRYTLPAAPSLVHVRAMSMNIVIKIFIRMADAELVRMWGMLMCANCQCWYHAGNAHLETASESRSFYRYMSLRPSSSPFKLSFKAPAPRSSPHLTSPHHSTLPTSE